MALTLLISAAALLCCQVPNAISKTSTDPLTLLRSHNARELGSPGWRRVLLEMRTGTEVTRSFTIWNYWSRDDSGVATLFVLEEPDGLKGTSYLLREGGGSEGGMEVYLHLPAGRGRVLRVVPGRYNEGLLGSDFGYNDVRMLIPTHGFAFRLTGMANCLDRPAAMIDAVPTTTVEVRQPTAWARTRLYLSADPPLLMGVDYHGATDGPPVKRMRVRAIARFDGVWTATVMEMSDGKGRSTFLKLRDAGFRITSPAPDLLNPANLPALARRVREGKVLLKPQEPNR